MVSLALAGDLTVGGVWEDGGRAGGRDAGIFPAHVPVVALSRSPPSMSTNSAV